MKKIIYSISVLLTSVFFTRNANAIWPDFTPVIPFAPQFCVMCVPPAISVAISYYDQAIEVKEDLEKYTDMTTLKQMAAAYVSKMGTTAFNYWRQNKNTRTRGVAYARTIEDSKIADMQDEASVKNAFVKLFLQYPSDKTRTMEAYKSIGDQLKMDTALEMYLTAVEMEKKLYGKSTAGKGETESKNIDDLGMLKQIDLIESCLVQGENCDTVGLQSCQERAGGGDDETKEDRACFWKSALQAEKLYDEIMRNNLFLTLMRSQYMSVEAIGNMVKIKEFVDEKEEKKKKQDKSTFLIDKYLQPQTDTAMSEISATVAFADLTDEEEKEAEAELSGYEENLAKEENVVDGFFDDADNPNGISSVIGDREDDVKSLQIINDIRDDLNHAQKLHNLKQTLPEYKKVYQDYADAQEKMEQAKANLQTSGECILNLMKPYYQNASSVWFGGSCSYYRTGQIICHYDPERDAGSDQDSAGLFDVLCPGDDAHECYVQELRSSNMTGGIANYLLALYSAAKDEDAAGDVEAFIDVAEEDTSGGFGSSAKVTTEGEGSEVKHEEDDLFATSRDSDKTIDDEEIDKITTQTSDIGTEDSVSNLKNQEEGDAEKEQARKDGLIRWVIGSEVAKELALDLDTGQHNWGKRRQKFPLWNDQIAFYQQYIDGKYDNIEEYIKTMTQADMLLKLGDILNVVYPYQAIAGIPPISPETQRKNAADLLKNLGKSLISIKQALMQEITGSKTDKNGLAYDVENTDFAELEMKQIEKEIADSELRLAQVKAAYEKKRKSKLAELKNWYAIMDDANNKLSKVNETYNKNNEIVKQGEETTPRAGQGLEYGKKIYANRKLSKDSPQNAAFSATIADNTKSSAEAGEKRAVYANKGEEYERIVKLSEEKVKKIKEDLEKMRTDYVKQMSDAEAREKTSFAVFTENLRAARQIDAFSDASSQVLPLDLSGRLMQCVRTYALGKVAEARAEIGKMKSDLSLYYAESAPQVLKIHNKMIEKITNIPLTELAECAAIGEIKDFDNKSDEDMEPVLNVFKNICEDDFCTTPDSVYFVGAIGLPRDFAAPKSPLEFSSAPLHEVFHFDMIDFNNVDKYYREKEDIYSNKKMYISFESFLNFLNANSSGFEYGKTTYDSTVPMVWKYILKRHAFVQKEMDLTPLLGEGEETENTFADNNQQVLLQSGIFPCAINDRYIIDTAKPEEIIIPLFNIKELQNLLYTYNLYKKPSVNSKEYDYLPKCQAVSLGAEKKSVEIYDKEAGRSFNVQKVLPMPGKPVRGSELGTILSYVVDEATGLDLLLRGKFSAVGTDKAALPHRLTFNQTLLDALATINKTEDLDKDDEASKFYMAGRILYDHNQFGDYLDQVEQESIVADNIEKIKKQIAEIDGKIAEVFYSADYVMSDDFNLLNEKDYNDAARVMDEQKNMYVDLAIQKLQTLPQNSGASQTVRDKALKMLHKIAVLQKDSDEIVTIRGDEELDELEEKIKTQKADKSVSEKYKEKEEAEEERQQKHISVPYCASYPVNGVAISYFEEKPLVADPQPQQVFEEQNNYGVSDEAVEGDDSAEDNAQDEPQEVSASRAGIYRPEDDEELYENTATGAEQRTDENIGLSQAEDDIGISAENTSEAATRAARRVSRFTDEDEEEEDDEGEDFVAGARSESALSPAISDDTPSAPVLQNSVSPQTAPIERVEEPTPPIAQKDPEPMPQALPERMSMSAGAVPETGFDTITDTTEEPVLAKRTVRTRALAPRSGTATRGVSGISATEHSMSASPQEEEEEPEEFSDDELLSEENNLNSTDNSAAGGRWGMVGGGF